MDEALNVDQAHDRRLELTVLVNGVPESKDYPGHEKVEEVIKSLLPPDQRHAWTDWQLSDRTAALDPAKSLLEAGVRTGDTLAFTKKDGGGGA